MGTSDVASDHTTSEHDHVSFWPFVAALGAGSLYGGIGLILVGPDLVPTFIPIVLIAIGSLGFLAGLAGWVYEAFLVDYWTERGLDRTSLYVSAMVLFLVSDISTFLGGFIYYAFIRVGTWPPSELPPLLSSLVLVNTLILIASSFTLHYGHEALENENRRGFLLGLGVTVLLGIVFLGGQALEYFEFVVSDGFTLTSGAFGSAFFGLTGLHGLHVALGVILLSLVFGRALRGQYTPSREASVQTVELYWHFVDIVWVLLVVVVYVGAALG